MADDLKIDVGFDEEGFEKAQSKVSSYFRQLNSMIAKFEQTQAQLPLQLTTVISKSVAEINAAMRTIQRFQQHNLTSAQMGKMVRERHGAFFTDKIINELQSKVTHTRLPLSVFFAENAKLQRIIITEISNMVAAEKSNLDILKSVNSKYGVSEEYVKAILRVVRSASEQNAARNLDMGQYSKTMDDANLIKKEQGMRAAHQAEVNRLQNIINANIKKDPMMAHMAKITLDAKNEQEKLRRKSSGIDIPIAEPLKKSGMLGEKSGGGIKGAVGDAVGGMKGILGGVMKGAMLAPLLIGIDLLKQLVSFIMNLAPIKKVLEMFKGFMTIYLMPIALMLMSLLFPFILFFFQLLKTINIGKWMTNMVKLSNEISAIILVMYQAFRPLLALLLNNILVISQVLAVVVGGGLIALLAVLIAVSIGIEEFVIVAKFIYNFNKIMFTGMYNGLMLSYRLINGVLPPMLNVALGIWNGIKLLTGGFNNMSKGLTSIVGAIHLPKLAGGGTILQTGAAIVHKGEVVTSHPVRNNISVNVNLAGGSTMPYTTPQELGKVIATEIERRLASVRRW